MIVFDQLKKSDSHLRTITWSVLLGMAVLLAGLWWVQVISYRRYAEHEKAQAFRTVRIPAIRGKILDRHGAPLAENQPSYNVSLYLDELREEFKQEWSRSRPRKLVDGKMAPVKLSRSERLGLEAQARYRVASNIVQNLGTTLRQPVALEYGQFLRHYTNQLALPLPLLSLDPAQIARFQEQGRIPRGLDLEIQPQRFYPGKTTAGHLLGFLVQDNSSGADEDAFFNYRLPDYRGVVGIEGAFNDQLRGKAGVKSVLVNSLGYRQSETTWTAAEPGRNAVLTLDLAIQTAAEKALAVNGPNTRGAVVVMNPLNGDILALASSPTVDPNAFIPRLSHAEARRLSDDQLRPQINRATQENYAPGSIFKIITGLACLDAGVDPRAIVHNPGYIMVGRRHIKDLAAPGDYDFRKAFIHSSNTYFITNGIRAGVESIVRLGQRLHLGERSGLTTRQEVGGNFPSSKRVRSRWFDGDTANLCIGQGEIAVTPLQMAVMTSAVANGGKVFFPRLVDRVEPADPASGEETVRFPAGRLRDELGVKPRSLKIVREAMQADVADGGTGKAAEVPGMNVCGKTGTAEVTDEHNRNVGRNTWFVSYAPFESPRYVVVVLVENGQSGGGTCAPIAQKIYRAIQYQELQNKLNQPLVARIP